MIANVFFNELFNEGGDGYAAAIVVVLLIALTPCWSTRYATSASRR